MCISDQSTTYELWMQALQAAESPSVTNFNPWENTSCNSVDSVCCVLWIIYVRNNMTKAETLADVAKFVQND